MPSWNYAEAALLPMLPMIVLDATNMGPEIGARLDQLQGLYRPRPIATRHT
jgi:hypothetical protein